MNSKALSTFYGLSIFVLMTALFVLQPANRPEVKNFQTEITARFSIAWQQTWGDQPIFRDVAQVYEGTTAFYEQASDNLIAMISYPSSDADIAAVFSKTYQTFAMSLSQLAHKTNAAPPAFASGDVAGLNVTVQAVKKEDSPWFTATDGLTGQKYCIAVYNGEINKYLGACANEYY